jgi:hypothetical protein
MICTDGWNWSEWERELIIFGDLMLCVNGRVWFWMWIDVFRKDRVRVYIFDWRLIYGFSIYFHVCGPIISVSSSLLLLSFSKTFSFCFLIHNSNYWWYFLNVTFELRYCIWVIAYWSAIFAFVIESDVFGEIFVIRHAFWWDRMWW